MGIINVNEKVCFFRSGPFTFLRSGPFRSGPFPHVFLVRGVFVLQEGLFLRWRFYFTIICGLLYRMVDE